MIQRNDEPSSSSQLLLPDVWKLIFSYLLPQEIARAARVDANFHELTQDDFLWKSKFQQHFPYVYAALPADIKVKMDWFKAFKYVDGLHFNDKKTANLFAMVKEGDIKNLLLANLACDTNLNELEAEDKTPNLFMMLKESELKKILFENAPFHVLFNPSAAPKKSLADLSVAHTDIDHYFDLMKLQYTALHVATISGDLELVKKLLKKKPNLHATTADYQYTALELAALYGKTNILKLLFRPDDKKNIYKLINLAAQNGHAETVKVLSNALELREFSLGLELMYAIEKNHRKAIDAYIKCGANLDARSYMDKSPLLLATKRNDKELIKLLVDHGANINIKDNNGLTPLHHAVIKGDIELAKFLIALGADVNVKSAWSGPPLFTAINEDQVEMTNLLLDAGADPTITCFPNHHHRDYTEVSCFHLAIEKGRTELVARLLDKDFDFNLTRGDGATPLFIATYQRHADIVKLLLEKNLNLNVPLKTSFYINSVNRYILKSEPIEGDTALHSAVQNGELTIIKALIKKGANPYLANVCGQTCLDVAKPEIKLAMQVFIHEYKLNHPSWFETIPLRFFAHKKQDLEREKLAVKAVDRFINHKRPIETLDEFKDVIEKNPDLNEVYKNYRP